MTQEEIDARISSLADEKYRQFNAKIVNTHLPMIGVRAPDIRKLAKEVAREGGDFLDTYKAENYEQILLYALVIIDSKISYERKVGYFANIIPAFDNWAHVDMTVSAFKQLGKNREDFLTRFAYLSRGGEFERRVMVIFLMDFCMDEDMLDTVFDMYEKMQCEKYYVNMGIAWGLSVALVKFYDRTLERLKKRTFNPFIMKKTVQKARESYRISPERKAQLKELI